MIITTYNNNNIDDDNNNNNNNNKHCNNNKNNDNNLVLKRTRQIGKGTIFKTRTRVSLASVLEHFPRDALLGERNRTNGSDMLHASQ